MKNEAKVYALKLIGLAEMVEDLKKSKNGRYEFCGDFGARDNRIHIFQGLANLAEDLGYEYLNKDLWRDDAYEFYYLGYHFFQIFNTDIVKELGETVPVEKLQERH